MRDYVAQHGAADRTAALRERQGRASGKRVGYGRVGCGAGLDARAIPPARPEHAGIYALSQGELPPGGIPATPALPNTGSLVQANADDTFTVFASPLNQPASLEFIGEVAYIVTLGGDVWTVDVEHHGR